MDWHRNHVFKVLARGVIFPFSFLIASYSFASERIPHPISNLNLHRIVGTCFRSDIKLSDPQSDYHIICFRSHSEGTFAYLDPVALDGMEDGFVYTLRAHTLRIKIGAFRPDRCRLDTINRDNGFSLSNCRLAGRWIKVVDPYIQKRK